tara:strand:+ start:381 stop:563 length:183 start_codon:yes stop_codon:yes gene_type:complete
VKAPEVAMGKVAKQISKIQIEEKLTLPQVFEKYPHLAELQLEEVLEEENAVKENKKLILG